MNLAVRPVPPWNEGGPSLRVGWDPTNGEYIVRAAGGHIIGATSDLEVLAEAIKFEAMWGFGAVEMHLQGCRNCQGSHGLRSRVVDQPGRASRNARRPTATLTLEDLGL